MNLRFVAFAAVLSAALLLPSAYAADPNVPQVEIAANTAGPRTLESLTTQSVVRDYRLAWQAMGNAFYYGSPNLLDAYFTGQARSSLGSVVTDQEKGGLHSQYLNQVHKLDAVFYAPEGDVLELHDSAEFDLQISDGDKVIHNQRMLTHYVVLMTPAADRWVVRQLQEVKAF